MHCYLTNTRKHKRRMLNALLDVNNSVKGWHHAFQIMIGSHHPQVFSFIGHILKEQGITDVVKFKSLEIWCRETDFIQKSICSMRSLHIMSLVQQYPTTSRIERYTTKPTYNNVITLQRLCWSQLNDLFRRLYCRCDYFYMWFFVAMIIWHVINCR